MPKYEGVIKNSAETPASEESRESLEAQIEQTEKEVAGECAKLQASVDEAEQEIASADTQESLERAAKKILSIQRAYREVRTAINTALVPLLIAGGGVALGYAGSEYAFLREPLSTRGIEISVAAAAPFVIWGIARGINRIVTEIKKRKVMSGLNAETVSKEAEKVILDDKKNLEAEWLQSLDEEDARTLTRLNLATVSFLNYWTVIR